MNILVSMRLAPNSTYHEERDAISHDWEILLDALGVLPVLVPNKISDPTSYVRNFNACGLLLTGGDNIGDISSETGMSIRDKSEIRLLESAVNNKLPVFGVCRGLHLINRHFGGSLSTDLPENHVNLTHEVSLLKTFSKYNAGDSFSVNSYHNHAVTVDGLSESLEAFATTESGIIEGLIHPELPLTAIQWHPERDNPAHELDKLLLRRWLNQCA